MMIKTIQEFSSEDFNLLAEAIEIAQKHWILSEEENNTLFALRDFFADNGIQALLSTKFGEWRVVESNPYYLLKCTNCSHEISAADFIDTPNYCPECGSKNYNN